MAGDQEADGCHRGGKKSLFFFPQKAVFLTSKNEMSGDPLQIVMEYVRMVFHVDILTYNSVLREVQDKTDKIMDMLDNIGELDAAISIASFREMLSLTCRPEFVPYEGGPVEMEVTDLYHPLIREPVANSISAKEGPGDRLQRLRKIHIPQKISRSMLFWRRPLAPACAPPTGRLF